MKDDEQWRQDYMMLERSYQEKYGQENEPQTEQEKIETAKRLIQSQAISIKDIAAVTKLPIEKVRELANFRVI